MMLCVQMLHSSIQALCVYVCRAVVSLSSRLFISPLLVRLVLVLILILIPIPILILFIILVCVNVCMCVRSM